MRLCLPCVSTAANWSTRSIMTNLQSCWITAIEEQIAAHGSLKMTYQIRDGSRVHLKITMADRSSAEAHELLWIFLDETQ